MSAVRVEWLDIMQDVTLIRTLYCALVKQSQVMAELALYIRREECV